jgi:hypothetical protein
VSSRSELQPGAYGVAAPLPAGGVEGSVGVVALTELDEDRVGPAVVAAAGEVGDALA